MQTYSHLIITAAFNGRFGRRLQVVSGRLPALRGDALLLGSVLPDLPLIALSGVAIARDLLSGTFGRGDFPAAEPGAPLTAELLDASMTARLFEVWFFENPWVIAAQNLYHSPLLLIFFSGIAYAAWRRGKASGGWFFWLCAAALLHTLIDIPLHVDDGPLLLFPLDWRLRFKSPISYWDPAYYGREWGIFEHGLDVLLLIYLGAVYRPVYRAWRRRRAAP